MGILRGKVGAALALAGVGVLALVVLIGRELVASPPKVAADVPHEEPPVLAPTSTTTASAPAPPVVGAIAHALAPAAVPADSAPAVSSAPPTVVGPPAAQALAAIIENPRATRPTNVV